MVTVVFHLRGGPVVGSFVRIRSYLEGVARQSLLAPTHADRAGGTGAGGAVPST